MISEKGQGLVEYALILILVAAIVVAIVAGFWALIALLIIPIIWPWLVSTAFPWFTSVVAGVMAGNPASIAIVIILVLVVLLLFFRRRR